ncbi:MAG: hypothetical protein HY363_02730 [Candidatus Aenigmarchaeota archaeon]|nr:hypothetical protein [Candidatus Aenigmarchaeota archaeon]
MKLTEHLKRLPEHIKATPEYKTLVRLAADKNLKTANQFFKYMESEINTCNKDLKSLCNVSTNNRKRVVLSKHLAFLRVIHEKVLPYL